MRDDMHPGFVAASPIVILALFFVSGFTGLVYEVFWLKKLALLFGHTSLATATTLATFFLGLTVGSAVWGRRCVQARFPLITYAILEAGVALSALLCFFLVEFYFFIYSPLFQLFGSYPAIFLVVKLLLAMVILFPTAFFMGGTFPVMSQYWVRSPATFGQTASLLYAVNTLGGALGAYTAGFHLPLLFGYRKGYFLTITVTAVVALLAWWIGRHLPGLTLPVLKREDISARGVESTAYFPFGTIWVLAFLSGFVALGLEVLWVRMFAQVLQNSVYSFSMILTVFLISLSFGSMLAGFLARSKIASQFVLFVLLAGSGFLVGLAPFIFAYITDGLEYQGREIDILNMFKSVSLVIFLPGVFLGSIFPYLMKISEPLTQNAGKTVGNVAAFNTAGGILGSLITGFLFLDFFGLWATIRIMAFVYLLTALFVAESIHGKKWYYRLVPVLGIFLLVSVLEISRLPLMKIDPVQMDEYLVEAWQGSSANVAVIKQNGFLKIVVNSHYTLGGVGYREAEEFQAHLPLFLHPKPESVFFLGMGTGITAGASLQHPVKKVVVSELIPEVVEASKKYFEPYTYGLFSDSRVKVIAEDGRNYLLGTKETFDLIIADLFLPWKSGVGNLYAHEHYETVLARLKNGGFFAQWIPLYQISGKEFGTIVRTMLNVFPMLTLWRGDFLSLQDVVLLIGHKNRESLDPNSLEERFLSTSISDQVARTFFTSTCQFPIETPLLPLLYYCGNLSDGRSLFDNFPVNTDDRPLVEYYAPLRNWKQVGKESPFFVRFELFNFLDQLLHAAPLREDRYMEKFTDRTHSLVHTGLRLHRARILSSNVDGRGEGDGELDRFRDEVLTAENVKNLFSPIKNKEEALSYYLFLMKNLGAAWESCMTYIINEDDYHSPNIRQWINNPDSLKEALNARVTEMRDIPGGYLISLVGLNPTFKIEIFERKVAIDPKGNISELSHKTLIDLSVPARE